MIFVKVIPHARQRYETCGDWTFEDSTGNLSVCVSDLKNWKFHVCIAVHEICEAYGCKAKGITQYEVDVFDMEFERQRELGEHADNAEPGDDPKAPYHVQHIIATCVERLVAGLLGVNWDEYEYAIQQL